MFQIADQNWKNCDIVNGIENGQLISFFFPSYNFSYFGLFFMYEKKIDYIHYPKRLGIVLIKFMETGENVINFTD